MLRKPQILILVSVIAAILIILLLFLIGRRYIPTNSSTVEITSKGSILNFKFNIISKDQSSFDEFAQRLNVNKDSISDLSLNLDQYSLEKINPILPAKLNLKFSSDSVAFSSKSNLGKLNSSLPSKDYEFATNSGKLVFKVSDSKNYSLNIDDPNQIMLDASQSGKLSLAPDLEGLFPIIDKVAKIRIDVKDGVIAGEILLK